MSVPCVIDYEDVPFRPHKPYQFAVVPRIGETVVLHGEQDEFPPPRFCVTGVLHVPDGIEDGRSAFTVLSVQSRRR